MFMIYWNAGLALWEEGFFFFLRFFVNMQPFGLWQILHEVAWHMPFSLPFLLYLLYLAVVSYFDCEKKFWILAPTKILLLLLRSMRWNELLVPLFLGRGCLGYSREVGGNIFFRGIGKTYAIDHVFSLVHLGVREKKLTDLDEENYVDVYISANYWVGPLTVPKWRKGTPRVICRTPWKNLPRPQWFWQRECPASLLISNTRM